MTPLRSSSTTDAPATPPDPDAGTPSAPRLQDWVGRQEVREDLLHPTPVQALAAPLHHQPPPPPHRAPLPPRRPWLHSLPPPPPSDTRPNGHPPACRCFAPAAPHPPPAAGTPLA